MSGGMRRAKPQPLEDKRRDRCRKWRIWTSLGKDAKGRNKRKTKVFIGTYSEACDAMEELSRQYANVLPDAPTDLSFALAANKWIDRQEAFSELVHSTADKKRSHIRAMSHHIGDMRLQDVTKEAIEEAYIGLLRGDSPSGRMLSHTYLNGVSQTVNSFLGYAEEVGWIAPLGKLRTFSPDTKPRRALTDEAAREFFSSLDYGNHRHVALALYLMAGLRRSEPLTLRWDDVSDFISDRGNVKTLHVHGTKSEAAEAVVPLSDELALFLLRWREIQALRLDTEGLRQTGQTLIVSEYGEPVKPASIGRWWTRNRHRFGLDDWTLHELRHTFATMLARRGVPIIKTAALMRDKSTVTVEQVYTHLDLADKVDAISVLSL